MSVIEREITSEDLMLKDAERLWDQWTTPEERAEIIAKHVNRIEEIVRDNDNPELCVWEYAGQPNAALFIADYVNSMFSRHNRGDEVVDPEEVSELYKLHAERSRRGQLLFSPVGYTVLSALTFTNDRLLRQTNSNRLIDYVCEPINDPASN